MAVNRQAQEEDFLLSVGPAADRPTPYQGSKPRVYISNDGTETISWWNGFSWTTLGTLA